MSAICPPTRAPCSRPPVVLPLRQLGAPDPHRAIDLVDYVDVNRFDAAASDDDSLILDEAGETASHAARQYSILIMKTERYAVEL